MNAVNFLQQKLRYLVLGCVPLISSCYADCDRYERLIVDEHAQNEIVSWADTKILSKTFQQKDTSIACLVGPGRVCLRPNESHIEIISPFREDEIRLLGHDPFVPDGIFIGQSSYRGLIVAKTDLDSLLKFEAIDPKEIKFKRGRVAIICREKR